MPVIIMFKLTAGAACRVDLLKLDLNQDFGHNCECCNEPHSESNYSQVSKVRASYTSLAAVFAPASSAWQQNLRRLHQPGSRICAGFISLAAEFAPASSAWRQHLRQLHQPGSSISASFTSLAAALALL